MQEIDMKLKLFGGRPILAEGYGEIEPLKVRDVVDIGYTEYMRLLNIITLEVKDFLEDADPEIRVFDLLILYGGDEIENLFEQSLSLFLGGEAIIDKDEFKIYIKKADGIKVVNRDNFGAIQDVVKWQNFINTFEEKKINSNFNPADEETRKLKERMDALAKKRDEIKKKQMANEEGDNDNEDIDFYDIVSAISSKSYGVSELNVMDLTIYQVYRKFKRLEIIDQYDISIKSILAGAKDVKLKHWSSKG